jgi:hypothetical protein
MAYAGAHASTANLTLVGAAGTAGAFWSSLAAAGAPMPALITSHVLWDLWIFLVAPTQSRRPQTIDGASVDGGALHPPVRT